MYGTRCSTVLLIDRNGEVVFEERRFDAAGRLRQLTVDGAELPLVKPAGFELYEDNPHAYDAWEIDQHALALGRRVEGRLNLETVPDSEHVIGCDTIIFSIGQAAGLAFIPDDSGVGTTRRGLVAVNPNTLAATRPGVFAAKPTNGRIITNRTSRASPAVGRGRGYHGRMVPLLLAARLQSRTRPGAV